MEILVQKLSDPQAYWFLFLRFQLRYYHIHFCYPHHSFKYSNDDVQKSN